MFKTTRNWKSTVLKLMTECFVVVAVTALGILVVKSETESLLYSQPFLIRAAKNTSAFIADSVMLIISLPICKVLDPHAERIMPDLHV